MRKFACRPPDDRDWTRRRFIRFTTFILCGVPPRRTPNPRSSTPTDKAGVRARLHSGKNNSGLKGTCTTVRHCSGHASTTGSAHHYACERVASGAGGGGGALRRAALGVGRRARGWASGEGLVENGGGEGGAAAYSVAVCLRGCGAAAAGVAAARMQPRGLGLRGSVGSSSAARRGGGRGGAAGGRRCAGVGVALRAAIVLHLETRPGGGGQRQGRLLARRWGCWQR